MSFLASRRHQEGLKKSHTNLLFTVMFLQYFSVEWLLGVHFLSWHNDKLSPTNEIVFLWGLPCWSCVHPVVCKSRAMYFWWRLILYYHLLSNLVWCLWYWWFLMNWNFESWEVFWRFFCSKCSEEEWFTALDNLSSTVSYWFFSTRTFIFFEFLWLGLFQGS